MTDTVRITEIFYSLQGESRTIGLPTVFVRLTGCPLRCNYCDTEYAFHGGKSIAIAQVMEEVASFNPRYVCVTGGEPLAQKSCWPLLEQLCDAGYQVSLETSGAMSCVGVDPRVVKVIDLKTPDSGEQSRNDYSNMQLLTPQDQVKFVVCSKSDYEWARFAIDQYDLASKGCEILISPSYGQVPPRELAEWILADNLRVRMQLQMHKLIWNDEPGH